MNQNVVLSIDTSNNKEIMIRLIMQEKEDTVREEIGRGQSQIILSSIENLLQRNNKMLTDVTEITVHNGPGSFTGLRVGVSIANTLGKLLHIPINGKKVGELIDPIYSS